MNIDLNGHVPIFQQIASGMRGKIARGVHRTGEGLPSIRALAVELRVNHNTVHRAYELLERQGLIRRRRGIGMFVATGAVEAARKEAAAEATERLVLAIERCLQAGMSPEAVRQAVEIPLDTARAEALDVGSEP